jgi:AcrR family transcriptional regulator
MLSKKYTRDVILKAAYELSKEIGLEALSMRKIANEVGCSVMPLYESFSTKKELIDALSTFNEKLYDLASCTMYDRYFRFLKEGLEYPAFFLSVVKYDANRQYHGNKHQEETINNLCNLMRKDDRLSNYSNLELYRVNSRIELFIIGAVYTYSLLETTKNNYPLLKNALVQTAEAIIDGFVKNN